MSDYVLVKTISVFESSYLIPKQEGMSVHDHLDYVTCQDVEETSQCHIDETILPNSTRVLSNAEAIDLFDRENDYLKSWSTEYKHEWLHNNLKNGRKET